MHRLRMDAQPSPHELRLLRRRVSRFIHLAAARKRARPYLVVTPLGFACRETLEAALAREGIRLDVPHAIDGWSQLSSLLYRRNVLAGGWLRAWVFENLWRREFPADRALWMSLARMRDYRRLLAIKPRLRAALPYGRRYEVRLPGAEISARLHPFHVPEPEDWRGDVARLAASRALPRHVRAPALQSA